MSRGDKNRNIVAALSYFFFFITGIVILLVEKDDKFIRFHAMQSVLIFGAIFLINIIISTVLNPLDFFGVLTTVISSLMTIITVVVWAVSMIKAYNGEIFKWPLVGKIAEERVR